MFHRESALETFQNKIMIQPLIDKLAISPDDDSDEVKSPAVVLRFILMSEGEYGARFWVPFFQVLVLKSFSTVAILAFQTGQVLQVLAR